MSQQATEANYSSTRRVVDGESTVVATNRRVTKTYTVNGQSGLPTLAMQTPVQSTATLPPHNFVLAESYFPGQEVSQAAQVPPQATAVQFVDAPRTRANPREFMSPQASFPKIQTLITPLPNRSEQQPNLAFSKSERKGMERVETLGNQYNYSVKIHRHEGSVSQNSVPPSQPDTPLYEAHRVINASNRLDFGQAPARQALNFREADAQRQAHEAADVRPQRAFTAGETKSKPALLKTLTQPVPPRDTNPPANSHQDFEYNSVSASLGPELLLSGFQPVHPTNDFFDPVENRPLTDRVTEPVPRQLNTITGGRAAMDGYGYHSQSLLNSQRNGPLVVTRQVQMPVARDTRTITVEQPYYEGVYRAPSGQPMLARHTLPNPPPTTSQAGSRPDSRNNNNIGLSQNSRTITYRSFAGNPNAPATRVITTQTPYPQTLNMPQFRQTFAEGHRTTVDSSLSVPISESNLSTNLPDTRRDVQGGSYGAEVIPNEKRQLLGRFEEVAKTPKQSAPSGIHSPHPEPTVKPGFKFLKLEDAGSDSHEKVEIVFEGIGKYVGGVRFGQLDGYGILYTADGSSILYEGEFEENQFNGVGIMFNEPAAAPEAVFAGELPTNWIRYEGLFLRNRRQGFGELFFKDGARYAGEFAEDRAAGFGKLVTREGTEHAGVWTDNKLVKAE